MFLKHMSYASRLGCFLSNTVLKAEERKEARNIAQERIEEGERKCRVRGERPSLNAMKALCSLLFMSI